jgi:hypothetical protein
MVAKGNNIKKEAMIKALTKSLGVVTIACKEVGIARKTHYEWYNEDEKYRKAVDDLADVALDFAESMLHKQIQDKDTVATIFYLKTKGKRRGYIEKQEIEHSGMPQRISITVQNENTKKEIEKLGEDKSGIQQGN